MMKSVFGICFLLLFSSAFSQSLDTVGHQALCACNDSECLYLENANLSSLPDALSSTSQVRVAFLGQNQFSTIPENIFHAFPYLNCLEINDNQIAKLKGKKARFQRLESLNLCNNQLEQFGQGLFAPKMKGLYLGGNPLLRLRLRAHQLPILRELSLNNCKLSSLRIDGELFWQLRYLDLGFNLFTTVPEGLQAMPVLEELSLRGNLLGKVFSIEVLPASLRSLNLEDCRIEQLEGDWSRLEQLERLDLGGNPLKALPKGIVEESQLHFLRLNAQKLKDPYATLVDISRLQTLETLIFQSADLDRLPEEITQLSQLAALDLQDCNFSKLPECLKTCKSLTFINLTGNPLLPGELDKLKTWLPDLYVRFQP